MYQKYNQINPMKKDLLFTKIENNFKDHSTSSQAQLGFTDIFFEDTISNPEKEELTLKKIQKEKSLSPQLNYTMREFKESLKLDYKKKEFTKESQNLRPNPDTKLGLENCLLVRDTQNPQSIFENCGYNFYSSSTCNKQNQYTNCFTKPIIYHVK